ncbi:MAG: hypothetical protein WCL00_00705 [Bacteroidota bacterium]
MAHLNLELPVYLSVNTILRSTIDTAIKNNLILLPSIHCTGKAIINVK